MKNVEKFGTFVGENGELICCVLRTERIWLYIRAISRVLPFIAVLYAVCLL